MLNFVSDMDRENTLKEEARFSEKNPALQCSDVHKEVCREYKEYNSSEKISESSDKCFTFACKIVINIFISCYGEDEEEEEEEE